MYALMLNPERLQLLKKYRNSNEPVITTQARRTPANQVRKLSSRCDMRKLRASESYSTKRLSGTPVTMMTISYIS